MLSNIWKVPHAILSGSFLLAVLMLTACGDDSGSTPSNQNEASGEGVVPMENVSISGVSQKGPFLKGSKVTVLELVDGATLDQTGKNFSALIQNDDGRFTLNARSMMSQYVELHAEGFYRNEVTGEKSVAPLTLYALTDVMMRPGGAVNINLLTHLEYFRVINLVKNEKLKVDKAKEQAKGEILNAFGIVGDFASSEDMDIFSEGDGNAALLAISILLLHNLSEASFSEQLTSFSIDIEGDGKWDDEVTKAKIADWARELDFRNFMVPDQSGNLYDQSGNPYGTIRGNIEKWGLGTVPDFEKYVRNFWYTIYGLGGCTTKNAGEVLEAKNQYSEVYGTMTRYICKDGKWVEATDFEKDTYQWKTGENLEVKSGNVTGMKYLYLKDSSAWISMDCWDSGDYYDDKYEDAYRPRCVVPKEARLNSKIKYGSMTDSRDKKSYKTVKIGDQTWMAENLNYYDKENSDFKDGSWCYNNDSTQCAQIGRLYAWSVATKACPSGWHLPTKDEFEQMYETAIGDRDLNGFEKAGLFKTQTGWSGDAIGVDIDAVGFSAMPAGYVSKEKKCSYEDELEGFCVDDENYSLRFSDNGSRALFWSATEINYAGAYFMDLKVIEWEMIGIDKSSGLSVRCVKD